MAAVRDEWSPCRSGLTNFWPSFDAAKGRCDPCGDDTKLRRLVEVVDDEPWIEDTRPVELDAAGEPLGLHGAAGGERRVR